MLDFEAKANIFLECFIGVHDNINVSGKMHYKTENKINNTFKS